VHDHHGEGGIRRLLKTPTGFEVRVSGVDAPLAFGMEGELTGDGARWRRAVELPGEAREFLEWCFPGARVVSSTSCCDAREVELEGGFSVCFTAGWEWLSARGRDRGLPSRAMSLLPPSSVIFLSTNLPGARVTGIAREANAYVARVAVSTVSADVVFCLSGEWVNACALDAGYRLLEEVPVSVLPPPAFAYVAEHFDGGEVAYAERHADGHVVRGRDGRRVDFTLEGELRRVETSARGGLPPGMIPRAARERALELFPGRRFVAYYPRSVDSPGGSRVVLSGHPPVVVHEFWRGEGVSVFWP
jgi:hypothetical protein